jgi:LysM repeat protein
MKLIPFFLFFIAVCKLSAQDIAESYIENYKQIALSEMERTGIPASIKLAQGLLESDWGRSNLAIEGNNHFGIKCGGNWNGKEFYKIDDDRDDRGRVIESCFREYRHPEESFIAHSEFLLNQEDRYGFLFELDPMDYKSWAKGLKKAGYATDPSYPKKLITIIEKYELYQYDENLAAWIAESDNKKIQQSGHPGLRTDAILLEGEMKDDENVSYSYNNEVKMILTSGNESATDIAARNGITVRQLLEFNDHAFKPNQILLANQRVYLEKKKFQYAGRDKFHQVRPGESMVAIAQHYGIQLESLCLRNRIPVNAEIATGEMVQLKGLRTSKRPDFEVGTKNKNIFEKADAFIEYYFTEDGYERSK